MPRRSRAQTVQAICLLALQMELLRRHRQARREEVIRWLTPLWVRELLFPSAAISVRGTSTAISSTTTITVPLPTGTAVGDVTFICVTTGGATTATTPSGWTALFAGSRQIFIYRAFQIGDGSVAITLSGTNGCSAEAIAYTGADTSTPIDLFNTFVAPSLGFAIAPSLSPNFNGSQLLLMCSSQANVAWPSSLAGFTVYSDIHSGPGGDHTRFYDQALSNGAATGNIPITPPGGATNQPIAICAVAVKAAGAATATGQTVIPGYSFFQAIGFSGSPQTITLPSTIANNDLVVIGLINNNGSIVVPPTGQGWVIADAGNGGGLFYKFWHSGDPTSGSWSGLGFASLGEIALFRATNRLLAIDTHGANTGTGASLTTPSLGRNTSSELLFCFFGAQGNVGSWTNPIGLTHVDLSSVGGTNGIVSGFLQSPSNPSGTFTAVSANSLPYFAGALVIAAPATFAFSGSFTTRPFRLNSFAKTGSFSTPPAMTGKVAAATKGSTTLTFDATHSRFHAVIVNHIVFNPSYPLGGRFFTRPIFHGVLSVLAIFPTLPGIAWPVSKNPMGDAVPIGTQSGGVVRVTSSSQSRWHFKLPFEFLRTQAAYLEFQQLLSFFLSQLGQTGEFLFDDQHDDTVTDQFFGNPDNVNTQFQLGRYLKDSSGTPTAFERIYAPMPGVTLKNNGVAVSGAAFTVGPTGLVSFTTAPANSGGPLTWSGNFWFRCYFNTDDTTFEKLFDQMWSNKLLEFYSVKP